MKSSSAGLVSWSELTCLLLDGTVDGVFVPSAAAAASGLVSGVGGAAAAPFALRILVASNTENNKTREEREQETDSREEESPSAEEK